MSFLLSNVPQVAAAEQGLISTSAVVEELDRKATQEKIQGYINREDVRQALVERGVAPEEVSSRLASLSESELRQLAGQVEQARAGGDILITILVVVLIIFLIKRM